MTCLIPCFQVTSPVLVSPCEIYLACRGVSWESIFHLSRVTYVAVVPSLSRVRLFVTPWTAARQASLSITNPPELTQTHVRWVGDAVQPSHPLSSPSPPALDPSQHQGLFRWVSSLHQVPKVLELQLQRQSFQWGKWCMCLYINIYALIYVSTGLQVLILLVLQAWNTGY